jgi:two-component system, cell cycle sensor histidine kinase and response regulator CckA
MKEQKCYSLEGRLFKTGGPTRSQARQRNSEASSRAAWGSEAGFGRAFDQAAIGMALVGLDGAWLRVNEALCQIIGYTEHELLATNFQQITHAQDLAADIDYVGQMLRREIRSYQMEKRYIHKRGHAVWILLSVSLVCDDSQPLFFFSQIQDITERKRAEEALGESDKRFQALLDNSPNLIFIKDRQGRYLLVNKEFESALGIGQEQIKGKKDEEVFPREQSLAFRTNDLRVLTAGVPMEFEEIALQEDSLHTSIVHKFPLFDANGKMYAIGGIATDITKRKRAEEGLRHREEEYRRLIENTPEVVWKADERGRVFFISEKIDKVFGYTRAAICSEGERLWFERMHPDDCQRVQEAYAKLFHEDLPFDVEYRIQHGDGHWMWWHNRAALIAGRPEERYAEGLLSDITERKEMEQQLRQKHKMEAIGQLAGGLAHDFNNLLTVIKGNSDILSDAPQSAAQQRSVEQIRNAADRAASLTRQLLAFTRMQVLQPTVLDLNAVVTELSKMLPRLISEHIEFLFVPDLKLGRVKADRGQLEQIIMNLAVNARDAMPHGGKLVVETKNVVLDEAYAGKHPSAKPGRYVLLTVSDTGHGMDAETQSHIFEPFFTTKEQGKGTGLGLATVYGIVKQSSGFIWVYSEPGRGATFKIYLPRVDESIELTQTSTHEVAAIRGTETLLLAEDEEAVRELVAGFLRKNGYTVLEAKNGVEALLLAEQQNSAIDLLLTDLMMPKMGGWELAERLLARRPGLKVLYVSGYSEYTANQRAPRDWRGAFVQKPFSMDILARKVREILEKPN